MAVDRNGDIALPIVNAMQPEFARVVDGVVATLTRCFPELMHSLYVYGSVAQGRATPDKSDLDMSVIFHDRPDRATAARLAEIKRELEKSYPVVSKIDFDCGVLPQVLHPDHTLSWGYWLKHHCVCVYGEDLSRRFAPFKPAKAIAVAVNGDFLPVLEKFMAQIRSSADKNEGLQLQRAAARKIIRATSILRSEYDKDWPDTLAEHHGKLIARDPEKADDMDYLLAASHEPQGDLADFEKRILAFARWLNVEFHRRQS